MASEKLLSVIIVNYNVVDFINLCLDAVFKATNHLDAEIIVVDNASVDDSVAVMKKHFPHLILIESDENLGFSKANNLAYKQAKGKYIHFLNPDTVIPENYYDILIPFMEDKKDIGAVGPKILNGDGTFAPDSKKAFPAFWVSVSKVIGFSKLFPKSTFFNKYYAAHIEEDEIAEVDILSGSTLLIKKEVIEQAGGPFDEDYFMYCEDLDLCFRIQQAGFKNYYVPTISMIHYKGESTRKLSYNYIKIFYDAHALFVKKYYPKTLGILYNTALKSILGLRHIFTFAKAIFSLVKLFILDLILLALTFIFTMDFWFSTIAQAKPVPLSETILLIPIFTSLWLISLFLNGAYDKPYSLYKAGRGMLIGGLLVLAAYSLLPINFRFSRGAILLSSVFGTLIILIIRWLLAKIKWINLVPRGKLDYSVAAICDNENYLKNQKSFTNANFQSFLIGYIDTQKNNERKEEALGKIDSFDEILDLFHVDEVIFDTSSLSYQEILDKMQNSKGKVHYNMYLPQQDFYITNYNNNYHLEQFNLHQQYPIGKKSAQRNKGLLDLTLSFFILLLSPLLMWLYNNKSKFFSNTWQCFIGKKTWIGYSQSNGELLGLPTLKPNVLPPYKIKNIAPGLKVNKDLLYKLYAENFTNLDDLKYWWINRRHLDY